MDKDLVLTRAKNAEMTHDFATAVRAYKELLKDNPKNIDYLNAVASIYVKAGEDEKAIPYYEEIISYYPHFVQAMNSLGAIFRRLHRYDESIAILQKALDEGRDSAMVNYNLGFTYKEMKMYADAIDCFEVTVSMNPDDVLAYNHMGSIYLSQKDYQKAIVSFKRGLQIDQNHPILNYNLATCYEQTDQIMDAIRCYELALKTKPGWTDAIHSFSELLLKCQKTKEAQVIVQRSISLYPNDEKLLCMLGNIFLTQFDYDSAEKTFKRAENVNKHNIEALSGLAEALEKNEKVEEALSVLEKALSLDPENQKLKKQEASALLSANEYDNAYDKIQNLYKTCGDQDSEVLDLYGQYYVCTNDDESALYYFNKIKSQDRHYKKYLLSSSNRYSQKGNLEAAEKSAQEYIAKRGADPDGYNVLGSVYAKAGNLDKAIETYSQGTSFPQSNIQAAKQVEKLKKQLEEQKNREESGIPDSLEEVVENQQEEEILNPEEIIEKAAEKDFDFGTLGDKGSGFQQIPISPEESLWDDYSDEFEDTDEEKALKEKEEAMKPKPDYYEPKFVQTEPLEMEEAPSVEQIPSENSEVSEEITPAESVSDEEFDSQMDEAFGMEEIDEAQEIVDLEPEGFEEEEADKSDDFDFSQFKDTTETAEPEYEEIEKPSVEPVSAPVFAEPEIKPEIKTEPVIHSEPIPREQYQAPSVSPEYLRELELQRQASSASSANYAMEIAMVTQQMAQKLADGQTKLALVQKELEEKVKQTEQMQEELVMHQLRAEQLELELQEKNQEYEDSLVQEEILEEPAEVIEEVEQIEEIEEAEEIQELEDSELLDENKNDSENESGVTSEQMFFLVNDNIAPDSEDFVETEPVIPDSQDLINQLLKEEKEIQMDFEFATVESILADLMMLENGNVSVVEENTLEEDFVTVDSFADNVAVAEEIPVEEDAFASVEDFGVEETEKETEKEIIEEESFSTVDDISCEEEDTFASVDDFEAEEEDAFTTVEDFSEEQIIEEKPLSTEQVRYLVDDEVIPDESEFAKSEKTPEEIDVVSGTQEYLMEAGSTLPQEENFASVDDFGTEEELIEETPAAATAATEEDTFASVDDFGDVEETSEEVPVQNGKSEMQALLQRIEGMLQDKTIASEYKAELEMFKKLKLLMEYLPAEAVSEFNIQKLRIQIEYIIARISGKPGLCVTITSLIKSGALGEDYASQFASAVTEENSDCSVEVIKSVIQSMKKLAENLPDNQLADALCDSADEVLQKIVE